MLSLMKMQEMYDMIMKHKRAMAEMQQMWDKALRDNQHEYDSDEEVDQEAGTWEHRLRQMEMEKTRGMSEPLPGKIAHELLRADFDEFYIKVLCG